MLTLTPLKVHIQFLGSFMPCLYTSTIFTKHFLGAITCIDLLVSGTCMQHASDKERYFNGVLIKQPAVDLLIVDVPRELPVPTVSIPPSSIS